MGRTSRHLSRTDGSPSGTLCASCSAYSELETLLTAGQPSGQPASSRRLRALAGTRGPPLAARASRSPANCTLLTTMCGKARAPVSLSLPVTAAQLSRWRRRRAPAELASVAVEATRWVPTLGAPRCAWRSHSSEAHPDEGGAHGSSSGMREGGWMGRVRGGKQRETSGSAATAYHVNWSRF